MPKKTVYGIAIGTLLVVGCDRELTDRQFLDGPTQQLIEVDDLGPDVILTISDGSQHASWVIWAMINVADAHGISIDGVKHGDTITIGGISGIGYFAGQAGWRKALSTVYKVAGAVSPSGSTTSGIITALSEDSNLRSSVNRSKPRDGYGAKLDDNGNFATEEGGIAVCWPTANGPMYAHGENRPASKSDKNGRVIKSAEMKGKCVLPTRTSVPQTVKGHGVLYVYAFDSNYTDNSGTYELRIQIDRHPAQ